MATIHPTAVVEQGVQLAEDVVIGPYCVVGSGVSIGPGTILDARVVLTGAVTVGRENHLYPNSVIGCCPQVLGMDQNDPSEPPRGPLHPGRQRHPPDGGRPHRP
jgi:UDP-N-acetylglucosamine acyltransferase